MTTESVAHFSLDSEEIEVIDYFCLLGTIINNKESGRQEICCGLLLGRTEMKELERENLQKYRCKSRKKDQNYIKYIIY